MQWTAAAVFDLEGKIVFFLAPSLGIPPGLGGGVIFVGPEMDLGVFDFAPERDFSSPRWKNA